MDGHPGAVRLRADFASIASNPAVLRIANPIRVSMPAPHVVSLYGEIDLYNAPNVCRPLDAIDGPAVIDLSDVRLLAAAGLTELARVAKRVGYGEVRLAGARPHVRRILRIVEFERLFSIDDAR